MTIVNIALVKIPPNCKLILNRGCPDYHSDEIWLTNWWDNIHFRIKSPIDLTHWRLQHYTELNQKVIVWGLRFVFDLFYILILSFIFLSTVCCPPHSDPHDNRAHNEHAAQGYQHLAQWNQDKIIFYFYIFSPPWQRPQPQMEWPGIPWPPSPGLGQSQCQLPRPPRPGETHSEEFNEVNPIY